LIDFGKWIFLSSIFTFFSVQGDRLLLGYYLDMAQLGIYSIAIMLSEAMQSVILKINYGVVLPAYGKVAQEEIHRIRTVVDRTRLGIDAFLILPIAALMILSSWIVDVLYDGRYHDAGWILQILCLRLLMTAALTNSETCLVALGHSKYAFMQSACRSIWILAGIPIGWSLAGIKGVVWAVALSEIPVVAVLWAGMVRKQVFSLRSELRSLLFAGAGALLGIGLSKFLS
jgi:O-antigen/teichoic acid export membrane protein